MEEINLYRLTLTSVCTRTKPQIRENMVELVITLHHFCNDWAFAVNPKARGASGKDGTSSLQNFRQAGAKAEPQSWKRPEGLSAPVSLFTETLGIKAWLVSEPKFPDSPVLGWLHSATLSFLWERKVCVVTEGPEGPQGRRAGSPSPPPGVVCGVGDMGWWGQLSERNPMQKRFLKTVTFHPISRKVTNREDHLAVAFWL